MMAGGFRSNPAAACFCWSTELKVVVTFFKGFKNISEKYSLNCKKNTKFKSLFVCAWPVAGFGWDGKGE